LSLPCRGGQSMRNSPIIVRRISLHSPGLPFANSTNSLRRAAVQGWW
jgi:hypothetical protein